MPDYHLLTELLNLPHVRVIHYRLAGSAKIELTIESDLAAAICPSCQQVSIAVHDTGAPQMIRDLPMWNRRCWLNYAPRRFTCAACARTFVEQAEWREAGQAYTQRYTEFIYQRARREPVAQIAQDQQLSEDIVQGLFEREAKKKLARRGYPRVKVLCLDEIAPHKGHGQYLLIISAPELGLVLDVLKDRKKAGLEAWFEARGVEWCAQVEVCCADMWDAYHTAAQTYLPQARLVVDRFHVMKNLNEAVTKARRTIQKEAPEAVKEILKGGRWLLVKNQENLTAEERQKLETMLSQSPELKMCYELKEDFRAWFNQTTDRLTAEQGLTTWLERVTASGLKALQTFVTTVQHWRDRVLNYFDGRHSNGFAEGVNLKIKLINRRAFGYHNFQSFRLHILVAFGP